jgi:hypothetical protein
MAAAHGLPKVSTAGGTYRSLLVVMQYVVNQSSACKHLWPPEGMLPSSTLPVVADFLYPCCRLM